MTRPPKDREPPDDGFLGRWSRRKAEARRGDVATAETVSGATPEEAAAAPDAPARDPAESPPPDLPDIESLTAESDFRLFMQDGVPDELKTRALRKLWRLKPSLANLDGLVDYGEDFTDGATVVAGMKTAYRVGRGYLAEVDAADAPAEPPSGDPLGDPDPSVSEPDPLPPAPAPAGDAVVSDRAAEPAGPEVAPTRPRPLPRKS